MERLPANGSAVQVNGFLSECRRVSFVVRGVIAMCLELQEAVVQARAVEAEYRYEGQQAEGELSLAADPVLRGIYESDRRLILPARVGLVEAC